MAQSQQANTATTPRLLTETEQTLLGCTGMEYASDALTAILTKAHAVASILQCDACEELLTMKQVAELAWVIESLLDQAKFVALKVIA